LRDAILSGQLRKARLPTEKQLAESYGVSDDGSRGDPGADHREADRSSPRSGAYVTADSDQLLRCR